MLTATAAGTLLGALWFVPSANATQDGAQRQLTTTQTAVNTASDTASAADTATGAESSGSAEPAGAQTRLADTGSIDTKPYVVGGTLFLGLGAGFVAYSVRRERSALS
ncbi:LPXTG cell wall anchor domain-containing protein [Streptomyces phyllanthi]|uniref:LPXTG cell wall anchor domain-containing protein n=1 Tax=Streptomyces phyllanthi TaxID=1803180 RepID=A0A5N8W5E7_9ACTN|nr:LPXTG cell wall anchor domain-containing protein [Streptomyces phyllanthi]